ncbi:MAG: hypothetical protein K2X87_06105 [Gemmataceae bacterium]|nr:hypothetical protein [Gemmataceae bacterium]
MLARRLAALVAALALPAALGCGSGSPTTAPKGDGGSFEKMMKEKMKGGGYEQMMKDKASGGGTGKGP